MRQILIYQDRQNMDDLMLQDKLFFWLEQVELTTLASLRLLGL
jgi:hypothetical protein